MRFDLRPSVGSSLSIFDLPETMAMLRAASVGQSMREPANGRVGSGMGLMALVKAQTGLTVMVCVQLAGCSGGPQLPSLSTASLPKIGMGETGVVAASSTEVYSRIARGANRCWFGGLGRLRGSHVLYADADSPQKGGAVEIIVHERAVDQPKIWGFKSYRIAISETGGQSVVTVENARMSDEEAQRMRGEVMRWAEDKDDCAVPLVAEPPPPEPSAKGKGKAKR